MKEMKAHAIPVNSFQSALDKIKLKEQIALHFVTPEKSGIAC